MSIRQDVYRDVQNVFGLVPVWMQQMPDGALRPFWELMRDFYLAETRIPNKYKELIGVAVSGATRCRYCTLFHTEGARLHGATEQEISEASMMAGVTMGGSSFINGQQVDYQEFQRETMQIVAYVKQEARARTAGNARRHA